LADRATKINRFFHSRQSPYQSTVETMPLRNQLGHSFNSSWFNKLRHPLFHKIL